MGRELSRGEGREEGRKGKSHI